MTSLLTHKYRQVYQKLLDQKFTALTFRNKQAERKFSYFYNHKYHRWMSMSVLMAILLYAASGIFDLIYVSNNILLQSIRFGIIIPLLFIVYLLIKSGIKQLQYVQVFNTFAIIIVAIGVLLMGILEPEPMRNMYFNAILLIQMYSFILSRLQFRNAIYTNILLFLILMGAIEISYGDKNMPFYYYYTAYSFKLLCGIAILGSSSYLIEKSIRREYLQSKLLTLEQRDLNKATRALEKLVSIDGLTNIFNHRHFHKVLNQEWQRNMRQSQPIALLILDIDYFKQYNDKYGHLAGDQYLKFIAEVISNSIHRVTDIAARYGGDEFVVLMVNVDREGVETVLKRIQRNTADTELLKKYQIKQDVSVSIGATIMIPQPGIKYNKFIKIADSALYQAKNLGRSRIVFIDNTIKDDNKTKKIENVIPFKPKKFN